MQLNRQEALSGVCKLLFIGVFCLYFYIYITLTSYVDIHEYISSIRALQPVPFVTMCPDIYELYFVTFFCVLVPKIFRLWAIMCVYKKYADGG